MKQRKIAVLGARAVGKSAVTIQYVEDHFVDSYNPTIENTYQKSIRIRNDDFMTDIMDTAGQDEYSLFHAGYSVGVHGYVLLYSVTNRQSFEMIPIINDKLLNLLGTDKVPRVLVGNKIDQAGDRQISTEQGQRLAQELGCAFIECSAKNNLNVVEVFIRLLLEIEKIQAPSPPEKTTCTIS
mmetsp:Transcript_10538/g.18461  ORF Transcript_10538/g.18461 Transcript_10538/m.18461 type:complete len:182 (+) Transcript_10538:69-614(+)